MGLLSETEAKPPITCRFALDAIHFLQTCLAEHPLVAKMPENPKIQSSIDIWLPITCKFARPWTAPVGFKNLVACKTEFAMDFAVGLNSASHPLMWNLLFHFSLQT